MDTDTAPATETRPCSPAELSRLIPLFRMAWGWSQETLAEISGLTVRTIQRVEAAQPSSLDTRRALARAFGMEDIDAFIKPHEFTTPEEAARAKAEFDRNYVSLEVSAADGRALLKSLSASGPYRALSFGNIGHLPREAEDLYAQLTDYLTDVLDVIDFAGQTEILGYGDLVEELIAGMRKHGFETGIGSRKVSVGMGPGRLPAEITYVMAMPVGGGVRHVAVEIETEPRPV